MKIILFGAGGQVGEEVVAAAADFPGIEVISLRRADADLAKPSAAAAAIMLAKPAAVINAAAWTAVDKAEAESEAAHRINALAAGEIAAASRNIKARMVQISTDYVFAGDGASTPLDENAAVRPLNVYGASKLRGEQLAISENPDTVVLRTSWVYSTHGANFVKTMLRLAETRDEIDVVDDQRGGPTPAASVARACLAVASNRNGPAGVFHFQGRPDVSWAEFAEAIFAAANLSTKVNRIRTSDYKTAAQRPLHTVLDCSKIERAYGVRQPDWRADIIRLAAQMGAKKHDWR